MRKWFKRWLFKEEIIEDTRPAYEALRHQGSIQAFKINNGYVVRVTPSDSYLKGESAPSLHYCKDHTEIAEHIVTQAVAQKMGVGQQMELPFNQPIGAARGAFARQTTF